MSDMASYYISAGAMAALQFYMHTQIKHMPIDEVGVILGFVVSAATTYSLAQGYEKFATSMRPKIALTHDPRAPTEPITTESANLALLYGNALYAALALIFAFFFLKDVPNHAINYALSSYLPAFVVMFMGSLDLAKKKSKL